MKTSRKNFVSYLELRLKPESAKSYLVYVDALSRALGKDTDYYFSSTNFEAELLTLLNGGLKNNDSFTSYSKKFQSNIRTGIRALIKFYKEVKNREAIELTRQVRIDPSFTSSQIVDHYIDKFGEWLLLSCIKSNGQSFKAAKNYQLGIRRAITDLNIDPKEFFSYTTEFQLNVFLLKEKSSTNFFNRSESVRSEIISSINKYKVYIAEKYGEKRSSLF